MNGHSISHWGIHLTEDTEECANILVYPTHIEKLEDELPCHIFWRQQHSLAERYTSQRTPFFEKASLRFGAYPYDNAR